MDKDEEKELADYYQAHKVDPEEWGEAVKGKSWRKPGLSDEENAELDAWEAEWESPEFKHGQDVGVSFGLYEAHTEAIAAYEAGEIDLWIEFIRPKSFEDWKTWEAEHGTHEEFRARWAAPPAE